MLKLEDIHVSFADLKVFENLNCQLHSGDFVAVMGANGSGKSTLFDIITGTTKPQRGRVLLNGLDISNISEKKRSLFIGRLFQNTHLASVETLTVRENLALATLKKRSAGLCHGLKNFPKNLIEDLLKPLNLRLDELLDTKMSALSGGQRQIISFIMATLVPPHILLLDEPTAALDPHSATQLLLFAKNFVRKQKIPTLMITHDAEIAQHMCNKLWIIKDGEVHDTCLKKNLQQHPHELFHQIDYQQLLIS